MVIFKIAVNCWRNHCWLLLCRYQQLGSVSAQWLCRCWQVYLLYSMLILVSAQFQPLLRSVRIRKRSSQRNALFADYLYRLYILVALVLTGMVHFTELKVDDPWRMYSINCISIKSRVPGFYKCCCSYYQCTAGVLSSVSPVYG